MSLAERPESRFEFEEVATTVEERSSGWWLVIKRLGLSLWVGTERPAIQSGDLLSISIKKLPGLPEH